MRPAGSVSITVSSTVVPALSIPFGKSATGFASLAATVSPFFRWPESMLRPSVRSISVCGAIETSCPLLDGIGLACAAESVAGARGVGCTGLDCAAESVAGSFCVFCAVAAKPTPSTAASASGHAMGSRNVVVRITHSSPVAGRATPLSWTRQAPPCCIIRRV